MTQQKKRKQRGQSFLQGALILTAGMALVKVIGALFKIPLKYAVGEYGMGLFNVAYHFYGPVFSLATAGFPVAVSRLVSESRSLGNWNEVRKIKRVAFPAFFALGGLGMVLMTFLVPVYCERVIGNPMALMPVLALAPAVLFACLGSVYRGYYEGLQNMTPTAVSQVVEAVVKLVLGLSLSRWVVSACTKEYAVSGTVFSLVPATADEAKFLILSFAAAGAVLGVTLGSCCALIYLVFRHHLAGDGISPALYRASPPADTGKNTARRLMKITLPIAVGSVATNVAGLIDATFLQSRLGKILETEGERLLSCFSGRIPAMYLENPETIPTFLYGCYSLAMTIYLLVPALTQPLGISALPAVTEAWAKGDRRELGEKISAVSRITALFCFPAGIGLSALSLPTVQVLYGEDPSSPIIGSALALLAIASLGAAICAPLSSMLQAVGRADLPVKLLLAAMAMKLGINWVLCGIPEINLYGAAAGTLICYLFLAVSQFLCLKRAAGIQLSGKKLFGKPLLCAILCGLGAHASFLELSCLLPSGRLGECASLMVSVLAGGLIYGFSLFLTGGVGAKDLNLLPNGQKIAKMLEKHKGM